jgi:hypothetical protein
MAHVLYQTDGMSCALAECRMEKTRPTRIIAAERVGDAILIEFADRSCAVYSSELLYAALPQAVELANTEPDRKPARVPGPILNRDIG